MEDCSLRILLEIILKTHNQRGPYGSSFSEKAAGRHLGTKGKRNGLESNEEL